MANETVDVVVSGVLSSGGDEDNQLVMPLSIVQRSLGLTGKIQAIRVSALTVPENELSRRARENLEALNAEEYDLWYCTAYVSSIAHQLEEAISGAEVRPVWQVAASEGVVIDKIQLLMAVVTWRHWPRGNGDCLADDQYHYGASQGDRPDESAWRPTVANFAAVLS